MRFRKLTKEEERVIVDKGTETPFSGEYDKNFKPGIYFCRRCGAPLYHSKDKFDARCGWPSFDDALPGAIKRLPDPDGSRTEIECARCSAHLGHVFSGEMLTKKNIRHCVNSISMLFIPSDKVKTETIVLGAGCFWCTEAVFNMISGVLAATPGYAGGRTENPTYEQVCDGDTGHAEVAKIEYFPKMITLKYLLDVFFTMHDPTSLNRQGNDVGDQYRSLILFTSKKQGTAVRAYIKKAQARYSQPIVTEVKALDKFYQAEDYHQKYFEKNQHQPYCNIIISPKLSKVKKEFKL